ncbi:MAG: response regulator [Chloroflexi bacterium]|nr:response regulator [Deltaproteobacteria bacterium]NQT73775.1 response regulator [Chloroflexota bacterium]
MTTSEQQISLLVVDDEKVVRDIIYRYFTKKGYDVLTTRNGQEALLLGSRGMFDIIILDINMPGINGLEVLHQLKSKYPNAKVIMLTGVADPEAVIQSTAEGMGALAFLKKPCELTELQRVIDKACDRN